MGKKITRLVRKHLLRLKGYQAVQPPEAYEEEMEVPVQEVAKLDANENPYGCSPQVREALAACETLHIYPDPEQRRLRAALEAYLDVGAEHIVAGSGSDELIDLLMRLFLEPGDKVVNCTPTFGIYAFNTQVCGGAVTEVPRDAAFAVDVQAVKAAIDRRTKLLFLASPNNPTGNLMAVKDIRTLLRTGVMVVVDEAYYEFNGVTVADLVPKHDNLCVLRTFSKWAGLAGLRAGYGVFPSEVARLLMVMKPPYNINAAAEAAALESLASSSYLEDAILAILSERSRLSQGLNGVPYLQVYPSDANFVLCRVLKGDARALQQWLRKKGILVRYFDTPRLQDCIRISVGMPEHTDRLMEALESWEGAS